MQIKDISTEKAPAAIGPYSQAVVCGNMVYTSGQIPIKPETGEIAGADVDTQVHQVLDNLKAVLEAAGSGLENVVKTTVYIKDMNEFAAVNKIYSEYFSVPYPARSCIEAARLPKDVRVEIEAVAVLQLL